MDAALTPAEPLGVLAAPFRTLLPTVRHRTQVVPRWEVTLPA
jgi:hypothetical protein